MQKALVLPKTFYSLRRLRGGGTLILSADIHHVLSRYVGGSPYGNYEIVISALNSIVTGSRSITRSYCLRGLYHGFDGILPLDFWICLEVVHQLHDFVVCLVTF